MYATVFNTYVKPQIILSLHKSQNKFKTSSLRHFCMNFYSALRKEKITLLQVKNNMAADLERLLNHREVTVVSAD